jgi:hypothetical protein
LLINSQGLYVDPAIIVLSFTLSYQSSLSSRLKFVSWSKIVAAILAITSDFQLIGTGHPCGVSEKELTLSLAPSSLFRYVHVKRTLGCFLSKFLGFPDQFLPMILLVRKDENGYYSNNQFLFFFLLQLLKSTSHVLSLSFSIYSS